MFRQSIGLVFIGILMASCELFSPGASTADSSLQALDTVINYNRVDVYPIFCDCEDYGENNDQKACFEASLSNRLSELLNKNDLRVKERVNDTTRVQLFIDRTGKASVVSIESPAPVTEQLPDLDTIIKNSVARLPKIKPAVKRGIFVNSQYTLAIIIRTL